MSARSGRHRRQPLRPIWDGHYLVCPRCRKPTHFLDVEQLPEMPAYESETTPVFRCPGCRFVFAPANRIDLGRQG